MAPRTGRSYGRKKKKSQNKREEIADLVGDMSPTQLAAVEGFIAGESQGENVRGLQDYKNMATAGPGLGVATAAPATAFGGLPTLSDTSAQAGAGRAAVAGSERANFQRRLGEQASANTGIQPEQPKGRLDRLKGFLGGGAKAIGGGIKRAADWANQEDLSESYEQREGRKQRQAANAAIQSRQGIMKPTYPRSAMAPSPLDAAPAAAPTAAGAGAAVSGTGRPETASSRAAAAAKRSYMAQQERNRKYGGRMGGSRTAPAAEAAPTASPPRDQAVRGPAASAMAQGNTTGTQSTNPQRKTGNLQQDGAGRYEDFGQSPSTAAPRKKGNPLTEGSFGSTAGAQNAITDAAGKAGLTGEKKGPTGPQMRAPIDDAGAMRPDAQAKVSEQQFKSQIEGLMQRAAQGERRAREELDALFSDRATQDLSKRNPRAGDRPTRTLDRTASFGEGRGTYGSLGGQNVPRSFQDRVLNQYRSQYNQIINAPSARNRRAR